MSRFAERSRQKELIDEPGIPFEDWATCLNELNIVNSYLGGHAITIQGIKELLPPGRKKFSVAEIGCGGGDNLNAIGRWSRFHQHETNFTGIDIDPACTTFAEKNCKHLSGATFICSDYREVVFGGENPDIIFNSLFCHHFTDDQLVDMLKWMKRNCRLGFFINDLQRHPLAFYSIRILTRMFSKSYLVRHDGPVSVLRGFKKPEWKKLLERAGITHYKIKWQWAFRYLIVVPNE